MSSSMSLLDKLSPRVSKSPRDGPSPRDVIMKGHLLKRRKGRGDPGSVGEFKRIFLCLRREYLDYYTHEHLFVLRAPPHQRWHLSRECSVAAGNGVRGPELKPGPAGEIPGVGWPFFLLDRSQLGSGGAGEGSRGLDQSGALATFAAETEAERDRWLRDLELMIRDSKWGEVGRISAPTGFRHNVHMSNAKLELPSAWIDLLQANGMSITDVMKNPQTMLAILDFASKDLGPAMPSQKKSVEQLQNVLNKHVRKDDPEPHFKRMTKVAEGGFGKVYLCHRVSDDQRVAVKVIKRTPKTNLQRVLNEIAMMYVLRDHPNVVKILDTYVRDDSIWVVMEYMHGGCLTDVLMEFGKLKEEEIAYVGREVLTGLSFMHHSFRIHRDIKSDNVLLDLDGSVKLADFGFAAQLTEELDSRTSKVGTYAWMAPEVILQQQYNVAADIWSFGMVCIEMAEKEPPYLNMSQLRRYQKIVHDPPPKLQHPAEWSEEFQDFLSCALVKDPEQRATADQLLYHRFLRKACTPQQFSSNVVQARNKVLRASFGRIVKKISAAE